MSAILLESIEGLGHSPFVAEPGETWERLQAEKEEVSRDLLAGGPLGANDVSNLLESAAADEYASEIRWRRQGQLEGRLRELNEAQDRLIDGTYGCCTNCEEEIDSKRLVADPAAARCPRCLACQRSIETTYTFSERLEIGSIH